MWEEIFDENSFNASRLNGKFKSFRIFIVILVCFIKIKRIEFVHNKGFVYRDIKPENFLLGRKGK